MASTTIFLTVEEVIQLHGQLIERFGGDGRVRDLGLVESALARPRSGYYTSLSEQGAALLQSLIRNHAFVDGNKRVAFASCAIFLRLNGYRLTLDASAAEAFLVDRVIVGGADVAEIASWLESAMDAR
ncbi:MAG: type II toxin-antitoxin system death-on-curing family toxin [Myxococcota bacterium]